MLMKVIQFDTPNLNPDVTCCENKNNSIAHAFARNCYSVPNQQFSYFLYYLVFSSILTYAIIC